MLEFPPGFFEEEERCGFVVSSMMKKAWAAQMEVLQIVADICKKYGLQYFAAGGTLIGAVRHRGFIPWDDDIDIGLKREEYNKLIQVLPEELPRGIVLGGMFVEPEKPDKIFPASCVRVRTDASGWDFKGHMERFHGFPYIGVGVDIFPYDYIPRDEEEAELQNIILEYGQAMLAGWNTLLDQGKLGERISKIEELCGITISNEKNVKWALQKLLDSVAALYGEEEADEMTVFLGISRERIGTAFHVRKECFDSFINLPFEQIEIPVPCGYHEALTVEYGDYMTYERGTQGHGYPCYRDEEEMLKRSLEELGFEGTIEDFCQRVLAGEIQVQIMYKMEKGV